jgi:hypothetical protein
MMIHEAIKVHVTLEDGRKFQRVETVVTDGSYDAVKLAASHIVGRDFKTFRVASFSWNYV